VGTGRHLSDIITTTFVVVRLEKTVAVCSDSGLFPKSVVRTTGNVEVSVGSDGGKGEK